MNQSLIIGKYTVKAQPEPPQSVPRKIAAFDLDDTVIKPVAGNKWIRSATSWQWWHACVPEKLKSLHRDGYIVVILSNQSGISLKEGSKILQKDSKSLSNFKDQLTSIFRQLDIPIGVYAATEQDHYRKPRTGMWKEVLEDYDLDADIGVDLGGSFFVGDAAGREKKDTKYKDHACSDRDLAANIGITFHTPEEYFLRESPQPFTRHFEPSEYLDGTQLPSKGEQFKKLGDHELVIFCGSPGAGKSTFFWEHLQPLGYERVNQDILKTVRIEFHIFSVVLANFCQRDKCVKVALEHLRAGHSVAVGLYHLTHAASVFSVLT